MENLVIKPLGKALEQAGLITNYQIRTALDLQSIDNQAKFGEILVSQGIIKQKTVDFFADKLPKLSQQRKTKPIGYYLQEASLIESQQIATLLEEQKQRKLLFGELLLEKGLLREKTLKFFLQYLEQTKKQVQLLSPSQQEIIKSLHLETLAASPYSLMQEVFSWTGGHPLLTKEICQIISDRKQFIPDGLEAQYLAKIVQENVIHNWEIQDLGGYLKTIQYYLLNNIVCSTPTLLKLYLQILQQEEVPIDQSPEQQELMNLGLVIAQDNKLKVSNRLYQAIFTENWVKQQLSSEEQKIQAKSNKQTKVTENHQQILLTSQIKNEPIAQIAAFTISLGLLVISPLVIFFNNSQHQLAQEKKNNQEDKGDSELNSQSSSMSTLCNQSIPNELPDQENLLTLLQQEKQNSKANFPENCRQSLDKLLVLNAFQLGKTHRVLDGIGNLCQISASSESFKQAQFWLARWYNSPDWGEQTKFYLNSLRDCPAANFIIPEDKSETNIKL